ncbi:CRISPR-associated helicase/endonuclease Cas3 [Rothia sp. HMSC065C12]|jgi:CRISPR-associated helicase cas3|uniref:CRISPR-associated helicase/endonuclease Cas3 n=1 Tax=unclassified Rothia (in: high G+C Gram-positive bacteria) TaxID=2689056 RepID=UPI0008A4C6FA|nr:CRISPR-associated helicase/endonuclease Cas3 [Rothia sp. HMSC065C12]OFJ99537.1 CRISPR-associated helicase/endonuclease Cas3 [Rothia sp. HMSC065C12]
MTLDPNHLSTPETASFWAKTGDKDSPTLGLSLVQHMLDAGSVAARLWDTWLAPGLQKQFSEHLHLSMEDTRALVCWLAATHDMGKATPEFSGQLDARRDENLAVYRQRIEQQDFEFPEDLVTPASSLRCPHSKYSQSILIHLFTSNIEGMPRKVAETLASISGAHHGTPADYRSNSADLSNVILKRLSPKWHATWQELYNITLKRFGASSALQQLARHGQAIPVSVQFCITGFVIMSDWIASNPDFFPMGTFGSAEQEQRARIGWQALGLEQRWTAKLDADPKTPAADLYASRFGWSNPTLRPMQEVVVEAVRSMQSGGMMCIEAPMGQGKTEAGLIAAEFLAQATGRTGVAFAAPTQATSNALFDRVTEWVKYQTNHVAQEHGEPVKPHSMFLGHSKNRFNKSYEALSKADIFDESSTPGQENNRKTLRPGTSLARHSWLSGTKKGLLSSFVVCTIDQVLMTALQARHVMLRYLGLASKVIIIDEVHAYDAYMSEYLSAALYWLGQMNAPVILMSATLPSDTRDDLMKNYAEGLKVRKKSTSAPKRNRFLDLNANLSAPQESSQNITPLDLDYPVIHTLTAEDNGTPKKWKVEQPVEQTEIELKLIDDSPKSVLNVLEPLANDHGCAAVICNTVGRAQEMHEFLRKQFGEEHVVLTHSRFTATHRAEQEELLVSKLGKKEHYSKADGEDSSRPHRLIVVGTQVIEQSLDLDFDVMITDFAPVDLVLQRMGRLHRHDSRSSSERTPAYRKPVCYVRGVETFGSHNEAPDFPRGSKAVYEPMILLSSYAQLLPHFDGEPIRIPADISPLVQKTYQENAPAEIPSAWAEVFESAKQEHKKGKDQAKIRAEGYLLCAPQRTQYTMADCMKSLLHSNDRRFSDEQIGEAKVRDTDASLEVIAIIVERNQSRNPKSAIKSYRLLPSINGTDEADSLRFDASADDPPTYWQSMQLAASSIRLPYQYSDAPNHRIKSGKLRFDDALDQLEKERIENWQKSFMLEGQLILPFEEVEAGVYSYRLCDYELVYTTQLGLQSFKLDNED